MKKITTFLIDDKIDFERFYFSVQFPIEQETELIDIVKYLARKFDEEGIFVNGLNEPYYSQKYNYIKENLNGSNLIFLTDHNQAIKI